MSTDEKVLALIDTAQAAIDDAADAITNHFVGDLVCYVGHGNAKACLTVEGIAAAVVELRKVVAKEISDREEFRRQCRLRGLRVESV